jgi:hypothetical protein
MTEHDPTAVEPGEFTDPSEAFVEEPPEGFESQVDLGPDQPPVLTERPLDPVLEAEDQEEAVQPDDDGDADDDDDQADEGEDE